ncbi:MAG: hypothetical protein DHS20C16_17460 [Phycisphaerae bacterium]|nr:MAG: hypothetical protein DHS20C16_17460 [Phycisphaerae bacterium]
MRRVIANSGEGEAAWFDLEADSPYRLIAFSSGGVNGVLKHYEKRAYWDRGNTSSFHPAGKAP